MEKYKLGHDATLSMVIEIEADSLDEAMQILRDKWSWDENFVHTFFDMAEVVDESTYDLTDDPYLSNATPIDEMC